MLHSFYIDKSDEPLVKFIDLDRTFIYGDKITIRMNNGKDVVYKVTNVEYMFDLTTNVNWYNVYLK